MAPCVGDSGGPLYYKNKQIGIVQGGSFWKNECDESLCGCRNEHTMWTFLWKHKDWIVDKTKVKFQDCSPPSAKYNNLRLPFISFYFPNNSVAKQLNFVLAFSTQVIILCVLMRILFFSHFL